MFIHFSNNNSYENNNIVSNKKNPYIGTKHNNSKHSSNTGKNIIKLSEHGFHSHKPSAVFPQSEIKKNIGISFSPVKELIKPSHKNRMTTNKDDVNHHNVNLNIYQTAKKKPHDLIENQIRGIDEDISKKDSKRFTSSTKNLNLIKNKPRHQKSYSNNMGLN